MSAWQGGYESRVAKPKTCEDCGRTFYSLHAHLEECPGRLEGQAGGALAAAPAQPDKGEAA